MPGMTAFDGRQLFEDLAPFTRFSSRQPRVQRGGIPLAAQQIAPPLDLTALNRTHLVLLATSCAGVREAKLGGAKVASRSSQLIPVTRPAF
jgi:hypothetical protein